MRRQAAGFNTSFVGHTVARVDISTKPFTVFVNTTAAEAAAEELVPIRAHSVILATGADSRWLGVPGEYQFQGSGVSSCATCDGYLFRDQPVLVIGGGDTAMEDALVSGFIKVQ
jgi:thioredoxin reductase